MIIVIAKLTVKQGKKSELLNFAKELVAATRSEQGCHSYSLLEDPYESNICTFVEEWQDQQALQRHFATPHMEKWLQYSAGLLTDKSLKVYQAQDIKL